MEPKLSKKKSLQYLKILAIFAILFTWEKPVGHNSHYRSLDEFEIKNPAWNQNYQQSRAPQSASSILKFWLFFAILAVKSAVSLSLDHLTAVSGVGSSPALATCKTSQVLLAGVPGGFSRGSPVSAPPTD